MKKLISSLVVATVGGALLALPGTASAGIVHVPQSVSDADSVAGIVQVHSRRYGYGYNSGAAVAGAIISGLAYGYGHRSYSRRHYGYGSYGYRHNYGYRRHYGYGSYGYRGYGGYGMYEGSR